LRRRILGDAGLPYVWVEFDPGFVTVPDLAESGPSNIAPDRQPGTRSLQNGSLSD
jgi:hypothetical protein